MSNVTNPEQASESRRSGGLVDAGVPSSSAVGKHLIEKVVIVANGIKYVSDRVIGNGSFGVVFQAVCPATDELVAIKKVLQDKRFKNRELQIMRMLSHPNIVQLKNSFYSNGPKDEIYLNLVLEFVPETLHRVARNYAKQKQPFPMFYCKLYIFQLCRALAYLHSLGICHRDIKPQNLLLNSVSGELKLCDFGSAKMLAPGEPNVSYICSRYYRAPELIFGATDYSPAIDVWSMGCVFGELLVGRPLFPGESGVDQLVEIIKALGTPTRLQIQSMNRHYTEFRFPQIRAHPWATILGQSTPPEAIDLISKFLQYSPSERWTPLQALAHPFFDELRKADVTGPDGSPIPPIFNFSPEELRGADQQLIDSILPSRTPVVPIQISPSSSAGSTSSEPNT